MNLLKYSMLLLILSALIVSCRNPEQNYQQDTKTISSADMKESLIIESRRRMREEVVRIDSWIERNQVKMITTGTGVRYRVITEGSGPKAELMSNVTLDYTLSMLDGTQCYSSDSTGRLQFILGQSDEPSGLQEVLMHLNEGTSAQIIVPSFLGYGLTGDGDCISGNESLLYTVKLVKVSAN